MDDMTFPGERKELFDEERHGRESSDLFLKDMIISFILAGRDTTSFALIWFFWLLSSYPLTDLVFFREDADNAEGSVMFSYEELKEMHYLHAALCESMRLYTPVLYVWEQRVVCGSQHILNGKGGKHLG
eukprot:Gb_11723 [translate_table: standard]